MPDVNAMHAAIAVLGLVLLIADHRSDECREYEGYVSRTAPVDRWTSSGKRYRIGYVLQINDKFVWSKNHPDAYFGEGVYLISDCSDGDVRLLYYKSSGE